MVILGSHESVSGGLHLAFERIKRVGGDALQIFTRNQRQWIPAELKTQLSCMKFIGGFILL